MAVLFEKHVSQQGATYLTHVAYMWLALCCVRVAAQSVDAVLAVVVCGVWFRVLHNRRATRVVCSLCGEARGVDHARNVPPAPSTYRGSCQRAAARPRPSRPRTGAPRAPCSLGRQGEASSHACCGGPIPCNAPSHLCGQVLLHAACMGACLQTCAGLGQLSLLLCDGLGKRVARGTMHSRLGRVFQPAALGLWRVCLLEAVDPWGAAIPTVAELPQLPQVAMVCGAAEGKQRSC